MNCEFCGREAHLSHYENAKEVAVYDCTHCPVLTSFYVQEDSGAVNKISFMMERQNKTYIWTNNFVKKTSIITDVDISLSSSTDKSPLILRFPKVMNINPQNVQEKLSLYLTFL